MGINTPELQAVTTPTTTDSILLADSAAGTARLTMAQAAAFFGTELVKPANPVGAALSTRPHLIPHKILKFNERKVDMNLYLYKIGAAVPVLTIEDAVSYTDDEVRTEGGAVYGPFAEGCELSSTPDCSETLRADWRREHCLADYPELMTFEERRTVKLAELSIACNAAITAGCDVALSSGSGHISLTAEDQINLSTATAAVEQGAEGYPYHLNGQLCAVFPAADIQAMALKATAHKLEHTTYYNHLAAWVRRCETVEELAAITYGAPLPEDLEANMAAVLDTAVGGTAGV